MQLNTTLATPFIAGRTLFYKLMDIWLEETESISSLPYRLRCQIFDLTNLCMYSFFVSTLRVKSIKKYPVNLNFQWTYGTRNLDLGSMNIWGWSTETLVAPFCISAENPSIFEFSTKWNLLHLIWFLKFCVSGWGRILRIQWWWIHFICLW